ncbi:pectate lyase [Pedobacter cryoconitis]|uniref:pectate lyase family protein n=1 Tax=Pedobacter cryoconitis TaxID=188932 RepID=UPI001614BB3F|nr:pectate lyase [Pedobacter cryoconitis]MBB6270770.1 pectate lyase [Pedobacter cryoconitis]
MKNMTSLLLSTALTFALFSCQKNADQLKSNSSTSAQKTVTAATCSAPGWASQNGGTTGGGDAVPTVVTNYAELKSAIQNTSIKVVQVNGTITIPSGGRISFQDQSGKTIYGSAGAKLVSADQTKDNSGIIYIKRCTNIIIRNLIFEGPGAYDTDGWDNATLDACTNIWVDHCEFRDGVDGNFDIKNISDYVTVSYCKFSYLKAPKPGGSGGSDDHRFSGLIGSSDNATADRGHFRITFVRCWWAPGCVARMPRIRFGKVHIVNSYYNSTVSKSCIQGGFEANALVESNVFENVKNPIDLMDNTSTAIQLKNNEFTNVTGNISGNGVAAFTTPYGISILSTSNVKANVTASNGAGATLTGNICSAL